MRLRHRWWGEGLQQVTGIGTLAGHVFMININPMMIMNAAYADDQLPILRDPSGRPPVQSISGGRLWHVNGPHRNRVTPLSEVAAINLRGAWMGNRGILHVGTDIVRSHASNLWITCVLTFKDWRAAQWEPHHYTVLFFHDEAVSLAAGHRPCALCRRGDYNNFRSALADATGSGIPSAKDLDRRLHSERIIPGTHRRRLHRHDWQTLPAGSFVLVDAVPILVLADRMVPWSTDGYGPARERPASGEAEVITPSSSVAALRAGYVPQIDATALGEG